MRGLIARAHMLASGPDIHYEARLQSGRSAAW